MKITVDMALDYCRFIVSKGREDTRLSVKPRD
jgi:hypothetical protein